MGMGETWVEIVTIEWPAKKNGDTVDHIQLYRLVYEMLVFLLSCTRACLGIV